MPGIFFALEGGEGSGKSTQSRLLAAALQSRGHEIVLTREPGGTPIGEAIRDALLGVNSEGMDSRTEALLFAAARAQHVSTLIGPALKRGAIVICDRYVDSSVAYQGAARSLGEQQISDLNAWATRGLQPDLTVLLDVDPVVGLGRVRDANRMEREPLAFHTQVREAFLSRARQSSDRYLVVSSKDGADEIAGQILTCALSRWAQLAATRPDLEPSNEPSAL